MTEFLEYISHLAHNQIDQVFFNSNEEKARGVFVELFNSSKDTVRIFAGSMCNQEVSNHPEYISALSNFIERGGKLRVILNEYDGNQDKLKESKLFKRIAYHKATGGSIEVKRTTIKPQLTRGENKIEVHFCTGDDRSYRIETDTKKRTAECNFNNPDVCGIFIKYFDQIFVSATEINLDDVL